MNIEKAKIYGVDKVGSSTPSALTRTDDAVGLSYTVGTTDIVSDFDRCYPWSDMQEVTDASGNVFIKIPKFYSKITKNSDGTYKHQISGIRYEGFSTLFVDGMENELDYVLVGKYEGSGSSARVYSKSGATVLVNITCDNFRTGCKANGDGYQQYDFLIDLIIKELWLVEMKTTNSQSVMYGYANGNSAAVATGRTDSIKTPSGSEESNTDGKHAMKYRGIENLWGNVYKWVDGISFSSEKVYVCTDPASYTAGKTASPYVYQGNRSSGGGYIKKVEPLGRNALIQYATEVGGSDSTYYADYAIVYGSVLAVGGYWSYGTYAGLWFWFGSYDPSDASSNFGGRLCYPRTLSRRVRGNFVAVVRQFAAGKFLPSGSRLRETAISHFGRYKEHCSLFFVGRGIKKSTRQLVAVVRQFAARQILAEGFRLRETAISRFGRYKEQCSLFFVGRGMYAGQK